MDCGKSYYFDYVSGLCQTCSEVCLKTSGLYAPTICSQQCSEWRNVDPTVKPAVPTTNPSNPSTNVWSVHWTVTTISVACCLLAMLFLFIIVSYRRTKGCTRPFFKKKKASLPLTDAEQAIPLNQEQTVPDLNGPNSPETNPVPTVGVFAAVINSDNNPGENNHDPEPPAANSAPGVHQPNGSLAPCAPQSSRSTAQHHNITTNTTQAEVHRPSSNSAARHDSQRDASINTGPTSDNGSLIMTSTNEGSSWISHFSSPCPRSPDPRSMICPSGSTTAGLHNVRSIVPSSQINGLNMEVNRSVDPLPESGYLTCGDTVYNKNS